MFISTANIKHRPTPCQVNIKPLTESSIYVNFLLSNTSCLAYKKNKLRQHKREDKNNLNEQ